MKNRPLFILFVVCMLCFNISENFNATETESTGYFSLANSRGRFQASDYTPVENVSTAFDSYNPISNNTLIKATIELNKSKVTIYTSGSKSVQLKAVVTGKSKKVIWKSSDPSVASVNSNGKVTAKKAGIVMISAKANGKTATCKITVRRPKLKLNKKKATVYTSGTKTVQLKAKVDGLSNKVTWFSSNKNIASVSQSGKVTAQKAGTVTVTAKANGVVASCVITVKNKKVSTIELSEFLYDSSVRRIVKKVPDLKIKSSGVYKSYATCSDLSIGILKDAPSPYQPDSIDVYRQITDIKNSGYKGVALHGVKIGDTYDSVKKAFQKQGIFPVGSVSPYKYTFYQGNAAQITTEFKNGRLASYSWKLRYTG